MCKSVRLRLVLGFVAGLIGLTVETAPRQWVEGNFLSQAHAVIGRPGSPGSVAGVARRTTRRVILRTTVYVAVLPPACIAVSVNNVTLYSCGGVYYQPLGDRYVVVTVQ